MDDAVRRRLRIWLLILLSSSILTLIVTPKCATGSELAQDPVALYQPVDAQNSSGQPVDVATAAPPERSSFTAAADGGQPAQASSTDLNPEVLGPAPAGVLEPDALGGFTARSSRAITDGVQLAPLASGASQIATQVGPLSLTPLDSSPEPAQLSPKDNAISYPNAAPGTTLTLVPQPDGIETVDTLSGPEAPNSFSWKFSVGDEARLEATKDGGVNVVVPSAGIPAAPAVPAQTPLSGTNIAEAKTTGLVDAQAQAPDATAINRAASAVQDSGLADLATVGSAETVPNGTQGVAGAPAAPDQSVHDTATAAPPDASDGSSALDEASVATGVAQAVSDAKDAAKQSLEAADAARTEANRKLAAVEATPGDLRPAALVIATVEPPSSTDANGSGVPTHLSVEGDTLTMSVRTDDKSAYPVTADPWVLINDYSWQLHTYPVYAWQPRSHSETRLQHVGYTNGAQAIRSPGSYFWGNGLYAVRLWGQWLLVRDSGWSEVLVATQVVVQDSPVWTLVSWGSYWSYDVVGKHSEYQFDSTDVQTDSLLHGPGGGNSSSATDTVSATYWQPGTIAVNDPQGLVREVNRLDMPPEPVGWNSWTGERQQSYWRQAHDAGYRDVVCQYGWCRLNMSYGGPCLGGCALQALLLDVSFLDPAGDAIDLADSLLTARLGAAEVAEDGLVLHQLGSLTPWSSIRSSLRSMPQDGEVVIGRQWDTLVARMWEKHFVLQVDDWRIEHNDEFIQDVINQRRTVYVASPRTVENLIEQSGKRKGLETVFARELRQLVHAGYRLDGDYLRPPAA